MILIQDAAAIVLVGVLWGCTNPFLNRPTSSSKNESGDRNTSLISSLFGIFADWKFLIPYGINQLGSAAYVYTLSRSDISMALPLCNALAVIMTVITSSICGERHLSAGGLLGVVLALVGITICFYAKVK